MHYTDPVGNSHCHPARCVVWTEPGAPLPPDLDRVLRKRGMPPAHAPSPHLALAEVCLAQRSGLRSALILAGVGDPARVLAAVERFAPLAVVWTFEAGANPPLRPFVPPNAPNGRERDTPPPALVEGERRPTPAPVPRTELKLGVPPPDPGKGKAPSRTISARDVLDDDELEMLLAGEKAMEDRSR